MIIFDDYKKNIEGFILTSFNKFKTEHGEPASLGIYCCPWAGWLSTNFNLQKTLNETGNNCPDFEYVEFDNLDLIEWEEEYKSENPTYQLHGKEINFNHDLGDEKLNKITFEFLTPLMTGIKHEIRKLILLQFLDSNCNRIFTAD